jgi:AraC-like DNA-binding protein/DNA gyrase inhibitor GyrI
MRSDSMNYYERIQQALDYIEENLTEPIELDALAAEAGMSLAVFYRLFYSLAGYTVKDYIRRRRLSYASMMLANTKMRIIDISLDCQFESQEAFTRAFRHRLGYTPNFCRSKNILYQFERIELMDTYFSIADKELIKKYPDIRVLKRLEPIKVAFYTAYSRTPENDAFAVLREWAGRNGLLHGDVKYRLFGFDTPDSMPGDEIYGYEVWMTIDNEFEFSDEKVKSKSYEGGAYAVTSAYITDIEAAWNRFREWLKISQYGLGTHQYLEEHLPFGAWEGNQPQGEYKVDLYMPVTEKEDKVPEQLAPVRVAYIRTYGPERTAPFEAWGAMIEWAKKNDLFGDFAHHRFFAYHNYNTEKSKEKQWYEVMVTVDGHMAVPDEIIRSKAFDGGAYITSRTNRKELPKAWKELLRWQGITKTKGGTHQWLEEWLVQGGSITAETEIRVFLPIHE